MWNFLTRFLKIIFLIGGTAFWVSLGYGQNADQSILQGWLRFMSQQRVGNLDILSRSQLLQELKVIMPKYKANDILNKYDFLRPVEQVGKFTVLIGKYKYGFGDQNDVVIFLETKGAKIAAVCTAFLLSVIEPMPMNWDQVTPYQVADLPHHMELTYYLQGTVPINITRPIGEGCANQNAKIAVERFQAVIQNSP